MMSMWLHSLLIIHYSFFHSVRSDFTGFATAALTAWKLTVVNAIKIASNPAITNIHQEI